MADQFGIEQSWEAIGKYADEILAVGNNGHEVLDFVHNIPSAKIEHESKLKLSLCGGKIVTVISS